MNGYVQPFSRRGRFQLEISFADAWIRGDENLAHVAIPKTHRSLFSLRSRADNQRLGLIADKANMQRLARPENSRLGCAAGRSRIARPVTIDLHCMCLVPFSALQTGHADVSGRV